MGSRVFYQLCFERYRDSLEDADKIYPKCSLAIVALSLVLGACVKILRIDLLQLSPAEMTLGVLLSVILYYLFFSATLITLILSLFALIKAVVPCSYKYMARMEKWNDNWYSKEIEKIGEGIKSEKFAEETCRKMIPFLASAQAANFKMNEKRNKAIQRSIFFLSLALFLLIAEGFFFYIIKIQGV